MNNQKSEKSTRYERIETRLVTALNDTHTLTDAVLDLETGIVSGMVKGRRVWVHLSQTTGGKEAK